MIVPLFANSKFFEDLRRGRFKGPNYGYSIEESAPLIELVIHSSSSSELDDEEEGTLEAYTYSDVRELYGDLANAAENFKIDFENPDDNINFYSKPIDKKTIEVRSSGGTIIINAETGVKLEVNLSDPDDETYFNLRLIQRFNINEYKNFHNFETLPDSIDILDLGYWDLEDDYISPDYEWRDLMKQTNKPTQLPTPRLKTDDELLEDFIEQNYPGYEKSYIIAQRFTLKKLIAANYVEGEDADILLKRQYRGDWGGSYPNMIADLNTLNENTYRTSIINFLKKNWITQ